MSSISKREHTFENYAFIFLLLSCKISEDLLCLTHLFLLPDHQENVFLTSLPSCKTFYIRNVCQCHTILYQLSGAEHCSFNLKTQWGKPLWSGSLEGATARITAFCLCIAGDKWGQDKTWKCRDRSANLLWPKQLRSSLTGVISLVGDANLNLLKDKGEFLSVEFIQKSLPEKSTWVT